MTAHAHSINGVPIRLTSERWLHITEHHDDLAGHYHDVLETIRNPDTIYYGGGAELLAVSRRFEARWLVVAYCETAPDDGFVITAFFTTRTRQIDRRPIQWTRPS